MKGAKTVHNAPIELAENVARTAGNKAKKGVKSFFKNLRADVKPKEKAPDPKNKEEYLAYQERRIKNLENQSIGDRIKEEVKEGWNNAVDKAERGAAEVYRGAKKAAKAVLNWFKW